MSGIPQVIVVSGNVRNTKQSRAKPSKKVGAATKPRKAPSSKSRSRSRSQSVASSSGTSDIDAIEVLGEKDEEVGEDFDLMEEESIHFGDTDSDSEQEQEEEEGIAETNAVSSPTKQAKKTTRKAAGPPAMETFIHQTAFDVYFAHASGKLYTSNNVLSSLVEPLTNEEVQSLEDQMRKRASDDFAIQRLCATHKTFFPNYWFELHNGFNLLFHGYGSKRDILTSFGRELCAKHGNVVIINGYNKRASLKAILGSIEQVPKLATAPLRSGTGWEGQVERIYDFFREEENPPLYLLIHNIESPALRDRKTIQLLSTLALHPRIHLIASADHINTALLWSSSEISARKHPATAPGLDIPPQRGYSWLFHDLTTFLPYITEMRARDVSSLPIQAQSSSSGVVPGQAMTEQAMSHILASVTDKAKRLFKLLATKQISAIDEEGGKQAIGVTGLEKFGMQYDLLFNEARKEFLATSDVALRALLGEFMDHGMILAGGQPEVLWIPAAKEVIRRALQNMDTAA